MSRAGRMLRLLAALALGATYPLATATPALAQTTFASIEGEIPAGWSAEYESHLLDYWNGVTVSSVAATDDLGDPVAFGTVAATRTETDYVDARTYEEFLDGYDPRRFSSGATPDAGDPSNLNLTGGLEYTSITDGTLDIDGTEFWYVKTRSVQYMSDDEDASKVSESFTDVYHALLPDGSVALVIVEGFAKAGSEQYLAGLESEAQQIFSQLVFDFGDGGASSASTGTAGSTGAAPWRTVVGGLASVIAAGAAIASAAAMQRGSKSKVDPEMTVGYVLQLSAQRLEISSQHSETLSAQVWRVTASGRTERADDAQISIEAPAGVDASPATGAGGTIMASVWQSGNIPASAVLVVAASAPGGGTRSSVALVGESESTLTLSTKPESKRSLRPTGDDTVTVVALLELGPAAAADPNVSATEAARGITFDLAGAGPWLDSGTPRDVEGGKAIDIAASSPDHDSPAEPPEAVTVAAAVTVGTEQLRESITIELERPPRIDARPDTVEFAAGTGDQVEVIVWIESPGNSQWDFDADWEPGEQPLATIEQRRESPSSVVLTLTENGKELGVGQFERQNSTIIVKANTPEWATLERKIEVLLLQEGLFLAAIGNDVRGTYQIDADGTNNQTDIDTRVYVKDESGVVTLDESLSLAVEFEPAEKGSAGANAWEYGPAKHEAKGIRAHEPPSAIHTFTYPRELPTAGGPLRFQLRATVPGRSEEAFERLIPVALRGVNMAPYSDRWNEEMELCRYVIDKHVPSAYRPELHEMVTRRGKTFGAEGVYQLRRHIWDFAQTLTMKEKQDALDEAWWNDQIIGFLDWVSWCGDIALAVATGQLVGTAAAVGVGLLKPVLVSAMDAWVNNKSIDEWAVDQLAIIAWAIEGAATDVDLLIILSKKAGYKGIALAWAVFIAYTFVKELLRDPNMSVTNAMINTCRLMRDQALILFLRRITGTAPVVTGRPDADGTPVKTDADTAVKPDSDGAPARPDADGGPKPDADGAAKPDAEPGPPKTDPDAPTKPLPVDSPTAKKIIGSTKHKNGKPYADPQAVLEIMADPEAARSLKHPDTDPAVREAFENTRQEIYAEHDRQLQSYVENNVVTDGSEVRVVEVRTPGKESTFNTDRDYKVVRRSTDPNTGQTVWIEVPAKQWKGESHRIFAENTGGPTDSPSAMRAHAERHQQLGTDRFDAEAPPDMWDQGWVEGPDGRMHQTQVESQLARTKRGDGPLNDPETLGQAYENKVLKASNEGHQGEAFVQAKKASQDYVEVRDGYEQQGYEIKPLDQKTQDGMRIVEKIGTEGFDSPDAVAKADAELRSAGFEGGLPEYMNRLKGQIGGLRWAKK